MQERENDLKAVLATVFKVDIMCIDENASPDTIEQWDSLKHMMLVLALEERFNISLTDEQTVEIGSYPLIKAVLAEHGIEFI
jgi:acyl carrier protein